MSEVVHAADEDAFLEQLQPPSEQTLGHGQSALWTLPNVATQYQPLLPTPTMQAALQAQHEGRFLDALILLDEANKSGQPGTDAKLNADTAAEMNLLRASFLLQGNQSKQTIETLSPLLTNTQHAADAWALTAMAYLQLGQIQQALDAAQHAHDLEDGFLQDMALSYVLQGLGHLDQARAEMHDFNSHSPQSAIALAREAELSLTLAQTQAAKALADQARAADATQPYVIAVSGLVYLIDGHAMDAKAAFETALKRDPKDAKTLFGLGLSEIKLGNFQVGQNKLQAANEADPGNALILTYLGRSLQQSGQTEAARASWNRAEQADPKDPTPWLYQAQAALQANRPLQARDYLREAQARQGYRSVYRGENLLNEDAQLLQSNLAEAQRRLGLESLAFQTLSDTPGEKNSATLRNQADALQGQRFGESARRSLLLQSLFDEKPGNLPSELDIYGDGAGQTGAQVPQHGAISGLGAQQASYNNYDNLFSSHFTLAADAMIGSQNTSGEQIRLGASSDTLGMSLAQRLFKTDGTVQPPNLLVNANQMDNRIGQSIVQWRPDQSTQAFVSYQTFHTLHGETQFPLDPINMGIYHLINDNSSIVRLGLRQSLSDHSELRGLVSRQQTDLTDNNEYISFMPPYSYLGQGTLPFPEFTQYGSSNSHSAELQYRTSGADSATQWGAQQYHGPYVYSTLNFTSNVRQVYAARQQTLNPHLQLDAQLAWEKMDIVNNTGLGFGVYLKRWLPKLGLVYTPDEATHVRLAAWRNLNSDTVGDATLAPATLAGIVTKLPGERNKLIQGTALGADRQLSSAWLLDGLAQQHLADQRNQTGSFERKRIDQARLALHWQPGNHPLSASFASEYEHVLAPSFIQFGTEAWDSVQEQRLRSQQLGLRWFAAAQWTVNLDWSHNLVSASMESYDIGFNPILIPYDETFNQTDAGVAWEFNKTGTLNIGVRNAENRHFQYTSLDPLNARFSNGRLSYAKVKFAW